MRIRTSQTGQSRERQGAAILIVIAMLTIISIVGVAFVYYSDSQQIAARYFKEADLDRFTSNPSTPQLPKIDCDLMMRFALEQLIYDRHDNDVTTALRGHSLARSMYGYNDEVLNVTPFNGTGRFHYNQPQLNGLDDYYLVNYQGFASDAFVRDPERLGTRQSAGQGRGPFTGGFNVSYTYPDANNMFLAAIRADGSLITPSFHREWLFGRLDNAAGPHWTSAEGKYRLLRPRTIDNHSSFAPPLRYGDVQNLQGGPSGNDSIWMDLGYPVQTTRNGLKYKPLFAFLVLDLDNRINVNAVGNLMRNNADHGSNQGLGPWEVSLKQVLFADSPQNPGAAVEWQNLFWGKTDASGILTPGRYGANRVPQNPDANNQPPVAPVRRPARYFAQVDLNADATSPIQLPQGTAGFQTEPTFPFLGGFGYQSGHLDERRRHATLYDVQRSGGMLLPNANGNLHSIWDDQTFELRNMELLLAHAYQGNNALQSTLAQLCPTNFAFLKPRNLVTTISWDVNRPSTTPWLWDRAAQRYGFPVQNNPNVPPAGPAVTFPDLANRPMLPAPNASDFGADWRGLRDLSDVTLPTHQTVQLTPADNQLIQQVAVALQSRLDLNRDLPPYPHQDGSLAYHSVYNKSDTAPNGVVARFVLAKEARERFAQEIYRHLLLVTGSSADNNTTSDETRRWLAQLAVNIVDFIDEDEVATSFNFKSHVFDGLRVNEIDAGDRVSTNPPPGVTPPARVTPPPQPGNPPPPRPFVDNELMPAYWVFGTERPRVVLNEVMTEHKNPAANANNEPTIVKVWAELFCPLPDGTTNPNVNPKDPFRNLQPQDSDPVPLYAQVDPNNSASGYSIYQLLIANGSNGNPNGPLDTNARNVLGTPPTRERRATVLFGPTIGTVGGQDTNDVRIRPQRHLIVGPDADPNDQQDPASTITTTLQDPDRPRWFKTRQMEYGVDYQRNANGFTLRPDERNGITVVLRRLANPHLPWDPAPMLLDPQNNQPTGFNPYYNPYVTIDYLEDVKPSEHGTAIASEGKRQPYASVRARVAPQTKAQGGNNNVQHTLGEMNGPFETYDWLVHLDRKLLSPIELLQVSGVRPHELTHRFITTAPPAQANQPSTADFRHRAPWFDDDLAGIQGLTDQSHRLYRFFEHVQGHHVFGTGVGLHGRLPGKINLNTVYDKETFLALCDPQGSNQFLRTHVDAIWNQLLLSRSYGMNPVVEPDPSTTPYAWTVTEADRPFRGAHEGHLPAFDPQSRYGAAPMATRGRNVNDTILREWDDGGRQIGANGLRTYRVDGRNVRLFQGPPGPGNVHPYQVNELLNKIYNNVTTRSNVFAVWLTTGLFEVVDDTTTPPKLGTELGIAQGTNQRCRFFAVVDRTQLQLYGRSKFFHTDPSTGQPVFSGWSSPRQFLTRVHLDPQTQALDPDPNVPWHEVEVVRVAPGQPVKQRVRLASLAGFTSCERRNGDGGPLPAALNEQRYLPWVIQPGSYLFFDSGDEREMVLVTDVVPDDPADLTQGGVIEAVFARRHSIYRSYGPGANGNPVLRAIKSTIDVTMPGNPGPQPGFNPNSSFYRDVVPYVAELN